MAKIQNDKYYTPSDLAEYCVHKTEEIIGKENITEYLEPSAGAGVFLDYLKQNHNTPIYFHNLERSKLSGSIYNWRYSWKS